MVRVYPEQAQIGRVYRPALGITSDESAFAEALRKERVKKPKWSAWRKEVRAAREAQAAAPQYEGALNLAAPSRRWNRCCRRIRSSRPMPATSPPGPAVL